MTDEEIESYYELIEPERKRRVTAESVWQMHMAAFEALQQMRARLAISVLRDINGERVAEVQKIVARIAAIQERISRTLMDCDFERWQAYIRPDHEEWAASAAQLRKHGESQLADDIGKLLVTMRVIVHAERRL
jgi:hypothetical protein